MAYNDDALEAITDLQEALEEFGSDIDIVTFTVGAYVPGQPEVLIRNEQPVQAIPSTLSSNENLNNLVEKYEVAFKIDPTYLIDEDTIIAYKGKDYKIPPKGFTEKVLQNTVIMYEIVVVANSV